MPQHIVILYKTTSLTGRWSSSKIACIKRRDTDKVSGLVRTSFELLHIRSIHFFCNSISSKYRLVSKMSITFSKLKFVERHLQHSWTNSGTMYFLPAYISFGVPEKLSRHCHSTGICKDKQ